MADYFDVVVLHMHLIEEHSKNHPSMVSMAVQKIASGKVESVALSDSTMHTVHASVREVLSLPLK